MRTSPWATEGFSNQKMAKREMVFPVTLGSSSVENLRRKEAFWPKEGGENGGSSSTVAPVQPLEDTQKLEAFSDALQ